MKPWPLIKTIHIFIKNMSRITLYLPGIIIQNMKLHTFQRATGNYMSETILLILMKETCTYLHPSWCIVLKIQQTILSEHHKCCASVILF